jgi:hypothetical protein
MFAATAGALARGGLFVFDVNNQEGFQAWWQGRRVYHGPRWTLTMDASFDRRTGLATGRASLQGPGPRLVSEVTERCFSGDEIHTALERAGFAALASEPWCPLPDDVPGKSWWVARRR